MDNGPFLIADLELDNGRVVEVKQPIDGFTQYVLDLYANEVDYLDKQVNQLTQALTDDYTEVLTDRVENTIFSFKAENLAKAETNPKRAVLYSLIAAASRELALS